MSLDCLANALDLYRLNNHETVQSLQDRSILWCSALPLSPTMPLTDEEYEKEMMFPVFDGLIPEGWLLDIASDSWKIDRRDRMQLLMCCCKDCIGDLSIIPFEDGEE